MAAAERRTLQELVGTSVNAGRLDVGRANTETPLLRVAALGAATAQAQRGPARQGLPLAASDAALERRNRDLRDLMLDPPPIGGPNQDSIAGELSALLWHIRYGGQHELVPRAAVLFGQWLTFRRRFGALDPARLVRFAPQVLHESLSDRCVACGGCGKKERARSGQWIRPRGAFQRNATFRPCDACHGSGRQPASETLRARALGIDRATYEAEGWGAHFNAAHFLLAKSVTPRVRGPLQFQLERGKRRP